MHNNIQFIYFSIGDYLTAHKIYQRCLCTLFVGLLLVKQ